MPGLSHSNVRFLVLVERAGALGLNVTADPDVMLLFSADAADSGDRCTIIPYDVRSVSDPDGLYADLVEGSARV